ncbi:MAG: methylated-DNA--[protein]-cysteine S-methyltransferase [Eubacteriaceae bacterium]
MTSYFYKSPIGVLDIQSNGEYIYSIQLVIKFGKVNRNIPEIVRICFKQLSEYFSGERKAFDLKIKISGTEFQRKVWRQLLKISYGNTSTYGKIAQLIGNPNASRAVGMANNKNKLILVIPCHRVVGSKGDLLGYVGGIPAKKYLLDMEKEYM